MKSRTSAVIVTVLSYLWADRRQPDWWREVAYAGTKLLNQPAPQPIVYIIPVTNILGRLPLVPYGEYGTIPCDWDNLARYYPRGDVIIRTALEEEIGSTTSIPGSCSSPQTTPALLAYQPAEKDQ